MTRQAEPLTVGFEGDATVWLPRGLELSPTEQRVVSPHAFQSWAAAEWLSRHGGRVARALRATSHPMRLSTALRVGVRLEVRQGRLYRSWVAFSALEDWLREVGVPGAILTRDIDPHAVTFRFEATDPPLLVSRCPDLVRCRGHGVHWYPERPEATRLFPTSDLAHDAT